ncbi:hypothetical protein D3C79_812770 [compost metagenome]
MHFTPDHVLDQQGFLWRVKHMVNPAGTVIQGHAATAGQADDQLLEIPVSVEPAADAGLGAEDVINAADGKRDIQRLFNADQAPAIITDDRKHHLLCLPLQDQGWQVCLAKGWRYRILVTDQQPLQLWPFNGQVRVIPGNAAFVLFGVDIGGAVLEHRILFQRDETMGEAFRHPHHLAVSRR